MENGVEGSLWSFRRLSVCTCDLQQALSRAQIFDGFQVMDKVGRLEEAATRGYAAQLMEGLQDLHSLNILHRAREPLRRLTLLSL